MQLGLDIVSSWTNTVLNVVCVFLLLFMLLRIQTFLKAASLLLDVSRMHLRETEKRAIVTEGKVRDTAKKVVSKLDEAKEQVEEIKQKVEEVKKAVDGGGGSTPRLQIEDDNK